jgi:hypothetical protein
MLKFVRRPIAVVVSVVGVVFLVIGGVCIRIGDMIDPTLAVIPSDDELRELQHMRERGS